MVMEVERKSAIIKNDEFKKKGLCTHSLDIGILCDHGCMYCSTPTIASARTKPIFKAHGTTAQEEHNKQVVYVDLTTPERVKEEAKALTAEDTVMLCTKVDPYSPQVQGLNIFQDCLRNLLESNPECRVRILSKNASIVDALEEFVGYAARISFSLSITAPRHKARFSEIVEPNASTIAERFDGLHRAKEMGFTIFGMICPCCPSILTDKEDFQSVFDELLAFEPEAIWAEPVNSRGAGLGNTAQALRDAGESKWADAVSAVSKKMEHDAYVANFINMVNGVVDETDVAPPVRMLIYNQITRAVENDDNVVWLKSYKADQLYRIHIDELSFDPESPRGNMDQKRLKELRISILQHGVLQPVLFRQDERGRPVLVSGNRRLAALRAVRDGLIARGVNATTLKKYETLPALVVNQAPREIALIENVQREELTLTEKVNAVASLEKDHGYTHTDLSRALGLGRTTVGELLSAPSELEELAIIPLR